MNTPLRFAIRNKLLPIKRRKNACCVKRVYKPNPVSRTSRDGDHSSGRDVTDTLKRPTRKRCSVLKRVFSWAAEISLPYLALHHEEFAWPPLLPTTPVSSYLTVSPITSKDRGWSLLCCTCRSRRFGTRTLSGSMPIGVRTFLPKSMERPPNALHSKAL